MLWGAIHKLISSHHPHSDPSSLGTPTLPFLPFLVQSKQLWYLRLSPLPESVVLVHLNWGFVTLPKSQLRCPCPTDTFSDHSSKVASPGISCLIPLVSLTSEESSWSETNLPTCFLVYYLASPFPTGNISSMRTGLLPVLCCLLGHRQYTVYLTDQRQKQILLCLGEKYYIPRLLSLLLPNLFAFSPRSGISVFELLKHPQTNCLSFSHHKMNSRSQACILSLLYQTDTPWFSEERSFLPGSTRSLQCRLLNVNAGTMADDFQIWHQNSHGNPFKWYHISQRLDFGLLILKWEAGLKINNLLG